MATKGIGLSLERKKAVEVSFLVSFSFAWC